MLLLVLLAAGALGPCVFGGELSLADVARRKVVEAEFAFARDLYEALRGDAGGNTVVSPLSVSTVLAVVLTGAGGRTLRELHQVLHLEDTDMQGVAFGYKALKEALQTRGGDGFVLKRADKLFVRRGVGLSRSFGRMAKDFFGADAEEMDFQDGAAARARINAWVEEHTNGKIKELFGSGSPSANSVLLLVNAMYLKAAWMKPFNEADTKLAPFYRVADSSIKVPMMKKQGEFKFAKIPQLQATMLALNYKGDDVKLKMVFLLPNKRDGLEEMESAFSTFDWNSIDWSRRTVLISLPKFKIEVKHELEKYLIQLGLSSLFAPGANLTRIVQREIHASKAVQKAFIAVDEFGTEAAVATGVEFVRFSAPAPMASFVADHPFMFLVMQDNLILFMGRVTDPSET